MPDPTPLTPEDIESLRRLAFDGPPGTWFTVTEVRRLLATLDAARPAPDGALREALRGALPRAINFRFLPPRVVADPIWDKVARDLVAALADLDAATDTREEPADG